MDFINNLHSSIFNLKLLQYLVEQTICVDFAFVQWYDNYFWILNCNRITKISYNKFGYIVNTLNVTDVYWILFIKIFLVSRETNNKEIDSW